MPPDAHGAAVAARYIPLKRSLRVLPFGVGMGLIVPIMTVVNTTAFAFPSSKALSTGIESPMPPSR